MTKFSRLFWLACLTISQAGAFLFVLPHAEVSIAWGFAALVFGGAFLGAFITLINEVVTDDPANKSTKKKEGTGGKK